MGHLPQISSLLIILCAISIVNSYSKYGRGCSDIGCLPSEVCVLAQDSCNFGQRTGKDCGAYPTCKKGSGGGNINSGGASLNPAPENTRFSSSSNPSQNHANTYYNQNPPQQVNPNYIFGAPNSQMPSDNIPIFPHHQPTAQPPFQQYPQFPQYPSYPMSPQNPYSPPVIFGQPPHPFYNPQPTTREPSLLHQFLYNKQDKRRNSSGRTTSGFIVPILGLIAITLHHLT